MNFFSQLRFHVTGTPPWFLKSTISELHLDYFIIAYFSLIFFLVNTANEATIGIQVLIMQHMCYKTPCHGIGDQILPNPHPMEVKDIPRGGKYPKYMISLTYLPYLKLI